MLFLINSDLDSCFYRWYARLIYAMTTSTICSPLKRIQRFDFADSDEDSDAEEKVIFLLGEGINFLLQLPTHNFHARAVKIESFREYIQDPIEERILFHYLLYIAPIYERSWVTPPWQRSFSNTRGALFVRSL